MWNYFVNCISCRVLQGYLSKRVKCRFLCLLLLGLFMPFVVFDTGTKEKEHKQQVTRKIKLSPLTMYLMRNNCLPIRGHWRNKKYAAKIPHCFNRVIENHKICSDVPNLLMLVYVYSAPQDFRKREAIRSSYANKTLFDGKTIRVVFPLGLPPRSKAFNRTLVQSQVVAESRLYNDIIQEDFIESYRNLTYKGLMILRWVNDHCSNAKYVLKVDSDVFVNIFSLISFLNMQPRSAEQKIIGCEVYDHMRVIRCSARPDLKSCTTSAQYKPPYYPPYCQGAAFLMTQHTLKVMHIASHRTPIWWVDDVFITGILLQRASKVRRVGFKRFWVRNAGRTLPRIRSNPAHFLFAAVRGPIHMVQAWKALNNSRSANSAKAKTQKTASTVTVAKGAVSATPTTVPQQQDGGHEGVVTNGNILIQSDTAGVGASPLIVKNRTLGGASLGEAAHQLHTNTDDGDYEDDVNDDSGGDAGYEDEEENDGDDEDADYDENQPDKIDDYYDAGDEDEGNVYENEAEGDGDDYNDDEEYNDDDDGGGEAEGYTEGTDKNDDKALEDADPEVAANTGGGIFNQKVLNEPSAPETDKNTDATLT